MKTLEEYSQALGPNAEGIADLKHLLSLCKSYGIDDWVFFDPSVVRGLAYYTGVVFEAFDRSGQLRAICGGGRYDHLLESMSLNGETKSSPDVNIPAVGFGFGDAVIVELLKMKNILPNFSTPDSTHVVVYSMDNDIIDRSTTLEIASALRNSSYTTLSFEQQDPLSGIDCAQKISRKVGLNVELVIDDRKPKWVFQRADRIGAHFVVMLAPNEHAEGESLVKNMRTGEQERIPYSQLCEYITKNLSNLYISDV